MSQPTLERTHIDYGQLLAENPNSPTLMYLNTPSFEARDELSRKGRVQPPLEADWGDFLKAELDYGEPTISLMAAVSVYIRQMRWAGPGNDQILNNAAQMHTGQNVVCYRTESGLGNPGRVKFIDADSGVLASEGRMVPEDTYIYRVALDFTHRKTPNLFQVTDFGSFAIGDEAISLLHDQSLGHRSRTWDESGYDILRQRLVNTAIMQRMGLVSGSARFERERQEVLDGAMHLTQLDQMFPKIVKRGMHRSNPEFVELLRFAHVLDGQAVDDRILELSGSELVPDDTFTRGLIQTVAEIRAPYALETLGLFGKKTVLAAAEVEVYGVKAAQELGSPLANK